jgi:hypothetical protein
MSIAEAARISTPTLLAPRYEYMKLRLCFSISSGSLPSRYGAAVSCTYAATGSTP